MKILLVGEYSGVHTNLAKALIEDGHIVKTISDGDGYKNFPRDLDLSIPDRNKFFSNSVIKNVLYYIGLKGVFSYFKRRCDIEEFKGFDIVQLINPAPITVYSSLANFLLIRKLKKNNGKIFLCALGDDYYWVKLCLSKKLKYSPLDNYNILNFRNYLYSLKYIYGLGYKYLNNYVISSSIKVIPGLVDYKNAYAWSEKVTDIVGIPIDQEQYTKTKKIFEQESFKHDRTKITVFHGWQIGKDIRKGNDILDLVMKFIIQQNPEKINYEVVSGLPYAEYIKKFDLADIFLDQIYSYDRGVNAIMGMANGKLVVSGFEGFLTDDGLVTSIGINGISDFDALKNAISSVINDDEMRYAIIKNSLLYVLDNHSPNIVVKKYIDIWKSK
ncbi:glycosyltransferase [Shewanella mangrovisoli]|uniref:glycosyltransferase n=1 Tax=Shewanella mangrovisoli TaxID=2864211 RepID=UPI0035B80094